MDKLEEVVTALSNLTLREARVLTRQLEARWGVSAAAPAPFTGPSNPPELWDRTPALKSVVLTAAGPQRIEVFKVVREALGLSLADARNLIDGLPKTLRDGLAEADAQALAAKLTAVGATVEVR